MSADSDVTTIEPADRPWFQWYEPSVPREIEIPDRPLQSFLAETAGRYPQRDAIRFMGRSISYRELDEAANRFANALIRLGVRPKDRVGLILPNCPQMVIGYYGALRAGAIVVPVNPLYSEAEIQRLLEDAGARVALCLSMVFPKVDAARQNLPGLEHLIVTNVKEYLPTLTSMLFTVARERREGHRVRFDEDGRTHWLQNLLSGDEPADPGLPAASDDIAVLQYTTGTTGAPKGVMLEHRGLVLGALQSHTWCVNIKRPDGDDVVLGVIPLFHTLAQTTVMNYPIFGGGTMVLLPRFAVGDVLSAIDKEQPNLFPGVPAMFGVLLDASNLDRYDLSSLRACICGAAPLPLDIQQRFEALSNVRLIEGYGLTEAPVTHCNTMLGERRIGTIGIPLPNTDAAIVDMETGQRILGPNETGEIVVRGPQVMRGYWNRERETAEVLRDGWLLTGDIGEMDEDGFFRIVDRRKDLIIVGGLNVYPSEVESVISSHPAVKESAVVAVPDRRRGEAPKAFVVLHERASASARDIIDHARERLATFKVPRSVEFRDELPRTLIGKVLRRQLAEEARADSASVESDDAADAET
jgi:long-chain acyl-CoA synthetase